MFHRHFSTNFKSFSPPKIRTKKSFFSPRGSAGVATPTVSFRAPSCEVPTLGGLSLGNPPEKARALSPSKGMSLSECGSEWFWVRLLFVSRVFGEGVKSARGETAILGRGDHTWNMFGTSLHTAYRLQTNYCTQNSRNNAIVLRPLRAIASHELLRRQTTIAATPLAESTPYPNTQKRGLLEKGFFFRKVQFVEILENLEILEILENPQTVEKEGESDHFLEILENWENLEILEIPPAKRPLS